MENDNPTTPPPVTTAPPSVPPAPVAPVPVVQPQGRGGSKRLLWAVVALVIVLVIALLLWSTNSTKTNTVSGPQATVQVTAQGFEPATLKIKTGTTVTWNNTDSKLHQIDSNPYPANNGLPGLSSMGLESGQSYSYTFKKVGKFGYHDQQNPTKILGEVDVSN